MVIELPDLTIKHRLIENPESPKWDLTCLVYKGGTKVRLQKANNKATRKFEKLTLKYHQISTIKLIKSHAQVLLELGSSVISVANAITYLKAMFGYLDTTLNRFDSVDSVKQALFDYSEYQYTRANLKEIQHGSAYSTVEVIALFLNGVFEDLNFQIVQTRLKNKKNPVEHWAAKLKKSCLAMLDNWLISALR